MALLRVGVRRRGLRHLRRVRWWRGRRPVVRIVAIHMGWWWWSSFGMMRLPAVNVVRRIGLAWRRWRGSGVDAELWWSSMWRAGWWARRICKCRQRLGARINRRRVQRPRRRRRPLAGRGRLCVGAWWRGRRSARLAGEGGRQSLGSGGTTLTFAVDDVPDGGQRRAVVVRVAVVRGATVGLDWRNHGRH